MLLQKWAVTSVVVASFCAGLWCSAAELPGDTVVIQMNSRQAPPAWALKERLLLQENERAVEKYFNKYWDERGYFKCRETWGIGKGSDDVLQATANFPLLYALGADRSVLDMYYKAYDAHIEQFATETIEAVPEWGIFHKGFVAYNDFHHHAEQYASFSQLPLADPGNARFSKLALRFAGFYLNEGLDPDAEPNYDYQHHVIRSGITGSRGALLEIGPEFWGYLWEEIAKGRRDFDHWTNVKGDLPMNLSATTFATNAFMLSGDEKYRRWVLDYTDAWCRRAAANGLEGGRSGRPSVERHRLDVPAQGKGLAEGTPLLLRSPPR